MPVIPKIRPVILYLDDEIQNRISFSAIFRRDYTIILTSSIQEAFQILENERVEIIICSEYICLMKGIDFLELTFSKYPTCSRLLVSDYVNADPINKAQIFGYLIKPWDEKLIGKILEEAHELFTITEAISKNFW